MSSLHENPEQTSSASSSPLLTLEGIVRLKADYEADVRLLEELPARIKLKKRKYEAALLFAPPGFDPDAVALRPAETSAHAVAPTAVNAEFDPPMVLVPHKAEPEFDLVAPIHGDQEAEGRLTWIGELARVLDAADRGLSHQEVLTILKQTELGQRVSTGEKGFYNAVLRLEKRGGLVKNGGLLYSPKLVEAMKARGETLPDVSIETRRRQGGSASVVMEVLRDAYPDGLDASQLRDEVAKKPGVPSSIGKHTHYIYNVLSTLMGQGEVVKDALGLYRAREKA